MKRLLMQTLCCLTLLFAACSDDDHDGPTVPEAARQALLTRYPEALRISWERKGGYEVAEFELPDTQLPDGRSDCKAWFDASGRWYMTEREIAYAALPAAVRTAFAASEYADRHIDDVARIERNSAETLYLIECEGGAEPDTELFYTADGTLFRSIVESDGRDSVETLLPDAPPSSSTVRDDAVA